eukprot:Selendium_serpulae@DN950_c0_g1_i2.p1
MRKSRRRDCRHALARHSLTLFVGLICVCTTVLFCISAFFFGNGPPTDAISADWYRYEMGTSGNEGNGRHTYRIKYQISMEFAPMHWDPVYLSPRARLPSCPHPDPKGTLARAALARGKLQSSSSSAESSEDQGAGIEAPWSSQEEEEEEDGGNSKELNCLVSPYYSAEEADGCVGNAKRWFKHPGGKCFTMGYSVEGMIRYPATRRIAEDYDTTATTNLNCTFPIPYVYMYPHLFEEYFPRGRPPPATLPVPERAASFVASNCRAVFNERDELVQFLADFIPVRSVGYCLHNTPWPTGASKKDVLKKFAMTFAFENQNSDDYVTEKVYEALAAGVVPVYYGADNIYDHLPSRKCVINVADFKTREDLGLHLRNVLSNDSLLMTYHEWREEPLSESWMRRIANYKRDVYCRFCQFLYGRERGIPWSVRDQALARAI